MLQHRCGNRIKESRKKENPPAITADGLNFSESFVSQNFLRRLYHGSKHLSNTIWWNVRPDTIKEVVTKTIEEKVTKRFESLEDRIAEVEKKIMKKTGLEFKDLLRQLRNGKNLSRKKLAEKAEIALVSVNKYEQGLREPKLETAIKLANALEVNPDLLIMSLKEYQIFKEVWERNHTQELKEV